MTHILHISKQNCIESEQQSTYLPLFSVEFSTIQQKRRTIGKVSDTCILHISTQNYCVESEGRVFTVHCSKKRFPTQQKMKTEREAVVQGKIEFVLWGGSLGVHWLPHSYKNNRQREAETLSHGFNTCCFLSFPDSRVSE